MSCKLSRTLPSPRGPSPEYEHVPGGGDVGLGKEICANTAKRPSPHHSQSCLFCFCACSIFGLRCDGTSCAFPPALPSGFWPPLSYHTQALETLSGLLGVKASLLEEMLTQRVVKRANEVFTKQLGVLEASLTRDAIVKSLYEVGREAGGGSRNVQCCGVCVSGSSLMHTCCIFFWGSKQRQSALLRVPVLVAIGRPCPPLPPPPFIDSAAYLVVEDIVCCTPCGQT